MLGWGEFQASNKGVGISYTLANDARKLYLVVQTADQEISRKLATGGLSLVVGKEKDPKSPLNKTVTYPYYERSSEIFYLTFNAPEVKKDDPAGKLRTDSFVSEQNRGN